MKLYSLVKEWLDSSRLLSEHFSVLVMPDPEFAIKRGKPEAFITYRCANTSAYRQSVKVDQLMGIFETYVEDTSVKIEAADPDLLKKLESNLRRKHDRSGEFNIITFRDDCPTKLRDCGCVKAFCGC